MDCTGARRTQLMAVYESALDGAAKSRRSNVVGQMSLFGNGLLEEVKPTLPDIPEYNLRTMLSLEKNVTGLVHFRPSAGRLFQSPVRAGYEHRAPDRAAGIAGSRPFLRRSARPHGRHAHRSAAESHQGGQPDGVCHARGSDRHHRSAGLSAGARARFHRADARYGRGAERPPLHPRGGGAEADARHRRAALYRRGARPDERKRRALPRRQAAFTGQYALSAPAQRQRHRHGSADIAAFFGSEARCALHRKHGRKAARPAESLRFARRRNWWIPFRICWARRMLC